MRTLPEINGDIGDALVACQVAAEQLKLAAHRYRLANAQLVALREEAEVARRGFALQDVTS